MRQQGAGDTVEEVDIILLRHQPVLEETVMVGALLEVPSQGAVKG